jgi:squalene-hopene/tetraprenyl-beta-curcumene cyclase
MVDQQALDETASNLIERLLAQRAPGGWWEGHLSSSALSTATAVSALTLAVPDDGNIDPGLAWLANNQNADGGWGDTVLSRSNISTTVLCWCALSIARAGPHYAVAVERAETWLRRAAGGLEPAKLVDAILRRYGADRTFSAPILTVLAIAGKLGTGRDAWRAIPQLPFELAAFPHRLFAWLRMPVVSYALPALIAIGQVRHDHHPSKNFALRSFRDRLAPATLRLLREIQPSTGGYLEATPLTSFVVMSLASLGRKDHDVAAEGVRFLRNSMRPDGSWPIDTNLVTWVTTLSVNALSDDPWLGAGARRSIRDWLLGQQCRTEHPYTHAAPGGWAWTPLSGGVPDADDTAGALLALRNLGPVDEQTLAAAANGIRWLVGLQNADGGMPTFCRGWGNLPFDRSGADLTAHAIAAWQTWLPDLDTATRAAAARALGRAFNYLARAQNADGSWTPLWFGNEHAEGEENRTYGTARAAAALATSGTPMLHKAIAWLEAAQNSDGGWGGAPGAPSTVEETAIAVHALSDTLDAGAPIACLERGVQWLIECTDRGVRTAPAPIGLYFARLWYYEELYPLIFAAGATIRARRALKSQCGRGCA